MKQAIEVFFQIAEHGSVIDGNLVSKKGRDELVEEGLAHKYNGHNVLTKLGADTAKRFKIAFLG